jgi:hypothetical protein
VPQLSDDVLRELYAVAPDEFMAKRAELAQRARSEGDADTATAIGKLRKPTVAAWIVNALVLRDPDAVDSLTGLGDRMRAAQGALDAAELRALSAERRKLVDKLTADAFKLADRTDPPAALRDEVTSTFDAAIADDEIAGRLGRLQRSEQSYGFGFLPTGAPQLTVVRGGGDGKGAKAATQKAAEKAPPKPKVSAAEKRKRERALAKARAAFDQAEAAFDEANRTERELTDQVRQLTKRLAKIQSQLDEARADLERARKDTAAARTGRREARSALDKAERDEST